MKRKNILSKNVLLTFFILCVAVLLRFWQLGDVPHGPYWDEVAMMVDIKTMLATGQDMHGNTFLQTMFPSYGDYKLPVFIWSATILNAVFGYSLWSLRAVNAFAGVAQVLLFVCIVPLFFKSWNKKSAVSTFSLGLIAAGVLAVSPWSILFSRTGFESHLGQFLVTCSLLFAASYPKSKKILTLSVLLGAVSVYTYYSVRFAWPVVFSTILIVDLWNSYRERTESVKKLLTTSVMLLIVSLITWVVLLLPMLRSGYYQPSQQFRLSASSILDSTQRVEEANYYRSLDTHSVLSRIVFHRHIFFIRDIAQNYAQLLSPTFLFIEGDPLLRHGTGRVGLYIVTLLPFLVLGMYSLWNEKKSQLFILSIWWIIALLPAAVPIEVPHAQRSLNALTPVTLIISYGLWSVWSRFDKKQLTHFIVGLIFIVSSLFLSLFWIVDYFTLYPLRSATAWQSGFTQLVQDVEVVSENNVPVVVEIGDDRWYLWYLAFSRMSGEEIQTLEYDRYQPKKAGNVYFSRSMLPPGTTEWKYVRRSDESTAEVQIFEVVDGQDVQQ